MKSMRYKWTISSKSWYYLDLYLFVVYMFYLCRIPDAAANVQALVTQSQEADDREITHVHGIAQETTHVHGIAQEHNALDTEAHNDGTNQMVGQAGLNAAANVDALVTQSQEDDGHETTHAHDIAQGHNAQEIEVHNDGPNQMVGQSGLTMK
jgi:hypothetical protein